MPVRVISVYTWTWPGTRIPRRWTCRCSPARGRAGHAHVYLSTTIKNTASAWDKSFGGQAKSRSCWTCHRLWAPPLRERECGNKYRRGKRRQKSPVSKKDYGTLAKFAFRNWSLSSTILGCPWKSSVTSVADPVLFLTSVWLYKFFRNFISQKMIKQQIPPLLSFSPLLDPGFEIRDPVWKKSESVIWDKHPRSATMSV